VAAVKGGSADEEHPTSTVNAGSMFTETQPLEPGSAPRRVPRRRDNGCYEVAEPPVIDT